MENGAFTRRYYNLTITRHSANGELRIEHLLDVLIT